jgi:hypothetical protein
VSNEFLSLLAAPFVEADVEWRITELLADNETSEPRASVRPQLRYEAVVQRLDETVGVTGWSCRYLALGEAVACELSIGSTCKSAVAESTHVSKSVAARDALVYAAELFGVVPPVNRLEPYQVDYDPETKTLLYEPEANSSRTQNASKTQQLPQRPSESEPPSQPQPEAPVKSAGQQAIDKLVERLEGQGRGKEVAKLIVQYGGYGQNPEAARELYGKLRNLLVGESS